MVSEILLDYVRKCLDLGYSDEEIRKALLDKGWPKDEVDEGIRIALSEREKARVIPAPEPTPSHEGEKESGIRDEAIGAGDLWWKREEKKEEQMPLGYGYTQTAEKPMFEESKVEEGKADFGPKWTGGAFGDKPVSVMQTEAQESKSPFQEVKDKLSAFLAGDNKKALFIGLVVVLLLGLFLFVVFGFLQSLFAPQQKSYLAIVPENATILLQINTQKMLNDKDIQDYIKNTTNRSVDEILNEISRNISFVSASNVSRLVFFGEINTDVPKTVSAPSSDNFIAPSTFLQQIGAFNYFAIFIEGGISKEAFFTYTTANNVKLTEIAHGPHTIHTYSLKATYDTPTVFSLVFIKDDSVLFVTEKEAPTNIKNILDVSDGNKKSILENSDFKRLRAKSNENGMLFYFINGRSIPQNDTPDFNITFIVSSFDKKDGDINITMASTCEGLKCADKIADTVDGTIKILKGLTKAGSTYERLLSGLVIEKDTDIFSISSHFTISDVHQVLKELEEESKNSVISNIRECNEQTGSLADYCYSSAIHLNKYEDVCEHITDKTWKVRCKASLINDLNLIRNECSKKFLTTSEIDICTEGAVKNLLMRDYSRTQYSKDELSIVCSPILNQTLRESCYNASASYLEDLGICEKISNKPHRDSCIDAILTFVSDPSKCNLTSDEDVRDRCIISVVRNIGYKVAYNEKYGGFHNFYITSSDLIGLCNSVESTWYKQECIKELAAKGIEIPHEMVVPTEYLRITNATSISFVNINRAYEFINRLGKPNAIIVVGDKAPASDAILAGKIASFLTNRAYRNVTRGGVLLTKINPLSNPLIVSDELNFEEDECLILIGNNRTNRIVRLLKNGTIYLKNVIIIDDSLSAWSLISNLQDQRRKPKNVINYSGVEIVRNGTTKCKVVVGELASIDDAIRGANIAAMLSNLLYVPLGEFESGGVSIYFMDTYTNPVVVKEPEVTDESMNMIVIGPPSVNMLSEVNVTAGRGIIKFENNKVFVAGGTASDTQRTGEKFLEHLIGRYG